MYEHPPASSPAYVRVRELSDSVRLAHEEPASHDAFVEGYRSALRRATEAKDAEAIAAAWFFLTKVWHEMGLGGEACTAHLELLATEQAHFGLVHPEVVGTWHNLGAFLGSSWHVVVAECCMRAATALRKHTEKMERDHDGVEQLLMVLWTAKAHARMFVHAPKMEGCTEGELVGSAYRCLGHAYEAVGRYDEALAAYAKALPHVAASDPHYLDLLLGVAEVPLSLRPLPVVDAATLAEVRAALPTAATHPERSRARTVLALAGDGSDVARILARGVEESSLHELRRYVGAWRQRGMTIAEIHRALLDAARTNDGSTAWRNLGEWELEQGLDARASFDRAIACGSSNAWFPRGLLALDDGDLAYLERVPVAHHGDILAWTARLEREVTDENVRELYGAIARWADGWRTKLDPYGLPLEAPSVRS